MKFKKLVAAAATLLLYFISVQKQKASQEWLALKFGKYNEKYKLLVTTAAT